MERTEFPRLLADAERIWKVKAAIEKSEASLTEMVLSLRFCAGLEGYQDFAFPVLVWAFENKRPMAEIGAILSLFDTMKTLMVKQIPVRAIRQVPIEMLIRKVRRERLVSSETAKILQQGYTALPLDPSFFNSAACAWCLGEDLEKARQALSFQVLIEGVESLFHISQDLDLQPIFRDPIFVDSLKSATGPAFFIPGKYPGVDKVEILFEWSGRRNSASATATLEWDTDRFIDRDRKIAISPFLFGLMDLLYWVGGMIRDETAIALPNFIGAQQKAKAASR